MRIVFEGELSWNVHIVFVLRRYFTKSGFFAFPLDVSVQIKIVRLSKCQLLVCVRECEVLASSHGASGVSAEDLLKCGSLLRVSKVGMT